MKSKFLTSVKGKVATVGVALMSSPLLFAGDKPVIPTDPLKADYAIFDYVFAGVVGVLFIFMVAKAAKSFVR